MQAIRTIIWVLLAVALAAFIAINWNPVQVNLWPLQAGYLYVNWPVGFIVLFSFGLGLLPMWLLHRAARWRLNRRISTLENTVKATTTPPPPVAAPMGTLTQLDAAAAATSDTPPA
ncbi:MAG TPA: LapA family protein [Novosphingobium sp.]|nr:LapA family protein [Novosphingobium sp.]